MRRVHEQLRDRVLSTAAHQLRGPLSVITGMASVLRATERGRAQAGLDTIAVEAARLTRMLENLFAVMRFSPDSKLHREWVLVEDVLGTALARIEDDLAAHPVMLAIGADVIAHADPVLLELLLVNLIDNAARHTPAGMGIDVSARREGTVTVIEIADRGPGIPSAAFDRPAGFSRGLGLDVCRGIVDGHGGAVVAWTRDGGGSVVLVTLPDGAPVPIDLTQSLGGT
ncbi:MAG: ATP-binding protein [Kofleriaceae bacterium]